MIEISLKLSCKLVKVKADCGEKYIPEGTFALQTLPFHF